MNKHEVKQAGLDMLASVAALAERSSKDGSAFRLFFTGKSPSRSGIIPIADLLVMIFKPSTRQHEYARFTSAWPNEFRVAGRITKSPRYMCSALAGMLDGVLYVGTDEVRWSPVVPGETRRPVKIDTKQVACGCTRYDLVERDIRKVGALNPIRMIHHSFLLMMGRAAYDPTISGEEVEIDGEINGAPLEVQEQMVLPRFLASVNAPYQKFKLRSDKDDAVDRAKGVIKAMANNHCASNESGASILLQVLRRANEGVWLDDKYGVERAPYTGMFRIGDRAGGIIGYHEAPHGYEGDAVDVGGVACLPQADEFSDFSEAVNDQLDRLFDGGSHHVRFEPTAGKEWTAVRQGQPLWQPKGTPKKHWTPAEIAAHPKFKDLALLAALATVETNGRLSYADLDLVTGSAVWVDLDSAPRVQLVAGSAGLRHFGNGVRCDFGCLDIEAHIRATKALRAQRA